MQTTWPSLLVTLSAVVMLAFGIAQTIIGAFVYNFTSNVKIGAFYVGIFAIICAILGLLVRSHASYAGAYPIMCVLTAVVALVGTLVDGIGYGVIGYIKACGNNGVDYWGNSDFYDEVLLTCELPSNTRDCYCVLSASSICYSYDGNGPDTFDETNCDPLMNEYPTYVNASWSICLGLFFYCWLVFFVGCCSCCVTVFGRQELPPAQQPLPSEQQAQSNPIAFANTTMPAPYPPGTPVVYFPPQQQQQSGGSQVLYYQPQQQQSGGGGGQVLYYQPQQQQQSVVVMASTINYSTPAPSAPYEINK